MRFSISLALCAAAATFGWSAPAAASLDACGNINVEYNAQCRIEVGGGCKAKCTPLNFVTTCRTRRYNACRKECSLQPPSVDCTGSCSADCSGSCTATPGRLECEGSCQGRCMTDCQAYCTESEAGAECSASCEATCSGECSASCEAVPPTASCEAACQASCDGSCSITAPYLECQTKCQEREYQECETELQGGCETQCSKPEGALFCDDQFIDHGNNLENCIDALNDLLTGQVDVSGSSTLRYECDGQGNCRLIISGSVSTGCAVAPSADEAAPLLLLLLGALVIARVRRERC